VVKITFKHPCSRTEIWITNQLLLITHPTAPKNIIKICWRF